MSKVSRRKPVVPVESRDSQQPGFGIGNLAIDIYKSGFCQPVGLCTYLLHSRCFVFAGRRFSM